MKTKTFLLACLLSGIGFTCAEAQFVPPPPPDNKTQTGSVPVSFDYDYWIPLYTEDGDYIDDLFGPGVVHLIFKFHKGNLISMDYTWKSDELTFVNGTSDEVFKVSDIGKQDTYNNEASLGYSYFKVNIIGNKGTRYQVDGELDWSTLIYEWNNVKVKTKDK
jgi:hypothetical protein